MFLIRFILNKVYFISFVLLSFQLTSCGLHVNYKSDKFGTAPVAGGTMEAKKYKEAPAYYPVWNVKNIGENEKTLDPLYYSSLNHYNDMYYNISKGYMEGYNSMLNVNIDELKLGLESGDFDTSSQDIVEKTNIGLVRAYPPLNNILIVQKLKNENQEIAIPSYIEDYVGSFLIDEEESVNSSSGANVSNDDQITSLYNDIKDYRNLSNDEKRDRYVEKQLAFTDAFEGISKEEYSEFFLE